jgi:formylglycine-generating enzyme required for sulfatase activity
VKPLVSATSRGPTGMVGRADLLRAYLERGEEGIRAMAHLLGFEPRTALAEQSTGEAPEVRPRPAPDRAGPEEPFAPIPFWRVEEIEFVEPLPAPRDETPERPITLEGIGIREGKPPRAPALVPDARLWPALLPRLAFTVESREVDVEALADSWARGRPLRRIPYRPLAAWAPEISVILDRSPRLIPFWEDQAHLLRQLRRRLGPGAVQTIRYREGQPYPWNCRGRFYRRPPVRPGNPVLALTDLGLFAGEFRQETWRWVGQELVRVAERFAALVPCPAERWQGGAPRIWDALDWSHPRRAPRRSPGLSMEQRQERLDRLLTLLAFTSRIEPGLLRALRKLLPATEADSGTEADVWNHPEGVGGFVAAGSLPAALRQRYQKRFAALPAALKGNVVGVLRAWRAGLPEEIWLEEVLGLEAAGALPEGTLFPEEIQASHRLWRRLAETLDGATSAPEAVRRALRTFVRNSIELRLPESVWEDEDLRPVLWRAWEASWEGKGAVPLPGGVGPEVLGESKKVRRWQVQQTDRVRCLPAGGEVMAGSPLIDVESANREVTLAARGARSTMPYPLGSDTALTLPDAKESLLKTDRTRATLRRHLPPPWASAMGRDRIGLWAAFEVEGVEQRLRWIPPGRFWMGSPEDEPGRWSDEGPRHLEDIPRGFWLAETPCTQALWEGVMGENPSRFQSPDRPVEQVRWEDCQEFLNRLNGQVEGLGARLPQENEWEFACRAGTEAATYAGPMEILGDYDAPVLNDISWYGGNSKVDGKKRTQPVAQKQRNPWGLYDMLGNVNEWCTDVWRSTYEAPYEEGTEGSLRVVRGGSWDGDARNVRAAFRDRSAPSYRWYLLGFRLARGQGALQGAERQSREGGAERRLSDGGAERGTRRSRRPSRPEGAT